MIERQGDSVEQYAIVERLAQIGLGTRSKALSAGSRVIMAANDDDGKPISDIIKRSQYIQPAHIGHIQVDKKTDCTTQRQRIEKLLPRREGVGLELAHAKQTTDCVPYRLVIVDNGYATM